MFFKDYSLLVVFDAYLRSALPVPRFLATCAISKLRCANWWLPIGVPVSKLRRDFKTAQRKFLLKLEMAVYITTAMAAASSKHTFTPTKLACKGYGCQHRHTLRTVLSSEVLRLYYSDTDGDSGEANAKKKVI